MPSKKGRPKGSATFAWRSLFQQSSTPVFVLGKGKRLRYGNPAWERLAGVKLADLLGLVCSNRRHSSPLAAAMAPTPEAIAGQVDQSRRAAPLARSGPPWWDVAFIPLSGEEGLLGIVGFIQVVGEVGPAESRKIPPSVMSLREREAARFTFDLLSERFAARARLAANIAAPVWLVGEPGSGKETAARVIHHRGIRREAMFLAIDCGGLQPFLIESLLWGHGGLAGSDRAGTLYLKEPAAMPRDLQQRLLDEFAEEPANGPRIICGSEHPPCQGVESGSLLESFVERFAVLELSVPPLRERLGELPRLLSRITAKPLAREAIAVLEAHAWPGNFRELAAVIAEAAEHAGERPIQRDHLPRKLRERLLLDKPPPEQPISLDAVLEEVEKRLLQQALAKAGGNATRAAERLGIGRSRMLRRIEALGLSHPERSPPPAP